jgi:hypothetical protein
MGSNYYKRGAWNTICDSCGFKFKSTELRKDWRGLYLCKDDWSARHPQDFLRARTDKQSVPWARVEPVDDFVEICYMWERSAYADLASADCALADSTPFTYSYLYALREGNG